jgi:hypothetical protein
MSETRREREKRLERWTGVRVADCSPGQIAEAAAAGYEPDGDHFIGRDPRRMSAGEIAALSIERLSPMQTIRAKCLDCMAGSSDEVRKCVAVTCPNWLKRTGVDVQRAPRQLSDAQREALRERGRTLGRRMAAGVSDLSNLLAADGEDDAEVRR